MDREQHRHRVKQLPDQAFDRYFTCKQRAWRGLEAVTDTRMPAASHHRPAVLLYTKQSAYVAFVCLQWREPPRGYDYHDRQVARERAEFPAAKRGRREGSPAYSSYRDVSPAPGPMFPAAPRDRYEGTPCRGRLSSFFDPTCCFC